MFNVTYLLVRKGQPALVPVAVKGLRTGRLYGHAHFEPNLNGHAFRISGKDWDAGAGDDILQFRAGVSAWSVKAMVEFDPTSAMGEQAGQLDAAQARVAELEQQVEAKDAEVTALRADLATLSGMVSSEPGGENVPNPPAAASDQPPTVEERLSGLKFPDLQKEAEDQNALGAGIAVKDIKSKIVLREALAKWYASDEYKLKAAA